MMKPISRQAHAATDYAYAAFFTAAPDLIGYKENETATKLSRVAGGMVFLTSLFTRYELGLVPVLPFKAHLTADVAAGLFAMGAPFLFGFSGNRRARNLFVAMGAFSVAAGLLTEPREMPDSEV